MFFSSVSQRQRLFRFLTVSTVYRAKSASKLPVMSPAGTAAGPSESLQVMLAHFSPL